MCVRFAFWKVKSKKAPREEMLIYKEIYGCYWLDKFIRAELSRCCLVGKFLTSFILYLVPN